jgi:hypothetical protein
MALGLRKIILILVLLLSANCFAATKYVSSTGSGTGNTVDDPMPFPAAITECTAGNIYTMASGTYTATSAVPFTMTANPASVATFQSTSGNPDDVIITNNGSVNMSIMRQSCSNIAINNVTIDAGTGRYCIQDWSAGAKGGLSCTGVKFTSAVNNNAYAMILSSCVLLSPTYTNCSFTASANSMGVYMLGSIGTATVTNCQFSTAGASGPMILYAATAGTLNISSGSFTSSSLTGGTAAIDLRPTTAAGTININGGSLSINGTANGIKYTQAAVPSDVNINGMTLRHTGTGNSLISLPGGRACSVTNNTLISSAASAPLIAAGVSGCGGITVTGNSVWLEKGSTTFGIYVYDYWTSALVANNTVEANNIDPNIGSGIAVGKDAATPGGNMGVASVHDNNVFTVGTSTDFGHGLLIGSGANDVNCYNNKVLLPSATATGLNLGLVVKAEGGNYHNNIIVGPDAVLWKGGGLNKLWNENYVSNKRYTISWATDTDKSHDNNVMNCIIDGSGGTVTLMALTVGDFNNMFNWNCMRSGSVSLANFAGSNITTLAGLRTYWSDKLFPGNDANSFLADPCFTNTATNDYSLKSASLCINAANDGNDIGAVDYTAIRTGNNSKGFFDFGW